MDWIKNLFSKKEQKECDISGVVNNSVYVTMDWAGNPITTKGDGYILPRRAEMIINEKFYPNKEVGEWPCDPITGKKLEIEPN